MKLIAIDLDGTLLSSEMEITEVSLEAMKEARAQGNKVMICSGRAPEDIQQILKEYDFPLPLAGSNGSVVQIGGQVLQSISMNREDAAAIAEKLDDEGAPYRIYTNKGIYIPADWSKRVKRTMEKEQIRVEGLPGEVYQHITEQPEKSDLIHFFDHWREVLDKRELAIQKFFVLTLNTSVKTALGSYFEEMPSVALTSSHPLNIEVMDQKANKGNALKFVAAHYGISLKDTMAIGDNFNDVPMLEVAGLSVAMENAAPQVKELCDTVTLSNNENGVAHAITKYILNK